ncbi:transglycosylase domain-containing protein [Deinococcus deserti]|uniref:peptidoglycan glycosyltransferase n=1 Tax=Deinococcus deserti (strain DSM 17065 / CIP 109153 / LMG 22923 / VCD115) TaxID=546414 RepID=C1CXB6_DEIDV|nr:transglycosylase domain-containing protein [Deinococcus deserti]ACO46833.2 putative peptidoglycan glycosyltransferase, precursor [Deinococcus deserti VCD115]
MWVFRLFGALLVLVILGVAGLWAAWGQNLPSVSDLDVLEFSGQTRVYDRTGQLVGTLTPSLSSGSGENRNLLKLGEISPWLQKAVVTSEDRRFFEHHGVDYIGIARGLVKGLLRNDLEGGSSITQQVVKNTLLSDLQGARTPERKFKEALLAYQIDRSFDKNKILNSYLNVVYWGDGGRTDIVGAGTAAHAYFRKNAADLNLAESVYLATIIPAPNRRYKEFKAYRPLMKSLLARMVEDGRVTQAEADAAWKTEIYPAGWRIGWGPDGTVRTATLERPDRLQENINIMEARGGESRFRFQHYLQAVEKELLPLIGRKALYGGGQIYTGMSLQAQQSAEQASRQANNLPEGATMGIALVSPVNGEVLALVGQKLTAGRPSDWNNATQGRRQVGSAIKPLLYTLALQNKWKQSDTVLDAPIAGDYQPMNYDRRWSGRYVTMRFALDHSLNLPTVRIAQELGIEAFEDKLREMNFTVPKDAGLSLSIGTLEASPLQMASAYATFANGGLYYAPTLVRKAQDARGKLLYTRPAPKAKRIWDAQTAWLGLDMIRGVVNDLTEAQGGLATRAKIPGWDVGGKTGTTNEIKDLWFAGVTPTIAGAVWVGKQEGGAMPDWAYSGTVPTPVWQQAVAGALQGQPKATFQQPSGITYRVVRQVNMAFREAEADTAPVARNGDRSTAQGGGFFGRRQNSAPAPEPVPAPVEPEVLDPEPTPSEPVEPAPVEETVQEIPAALPADPEPLPEPSASDFPAPTPSAPEPAQPEPAAPEAVPPPEAPPVPVEDPSGTVEYEPEEPLPEDESFGEPPFDPDSSAPPLE